MVARRPDGVPEPVIDGRPDDPAWEYATLRFQPAFPESVRGSGGPRKVAHAAGR